MIHLRAVSESYERQEISDVGWIQSEHNVRDRLIKLSPCPPFETLMDTERLYMEVQQ